MSRVNISLALKLFKQGESLDSIGKNFGVSKQRIHQIFKSNGISRSSKETWDFRINKKKKTILSMWDNGSTLIEIAKEVKHGPIKVKEIISDYLASKGIDINREFSQRATRTSIDDDEFMALYKEGMGYTTLSYYYGVKWNRIKNIATRLGLPPKKPGRFKKGA